MPLEYSRGPDKTRACGGLRVEDGKALTLCAPSRNSEQYQRFLRQAEDASPHGEIVIITGNLSSRDSKAARAWLEDHPASGTPSSPREPAGSTCKKPGGRPRPKHRSYRRRFVHAL